MKNQVILILALTIFILTCVSSASAEDTSKTQSVYDNLNSAQVSSYSVGDSKENVISGNVKDCITKKAFLGVNVTVTNNGKFIASNLTKQDGTYSINFLSDYTNFNVTASYTGHKSVTKNVTISPANALQQSGNVNFELGAALNPITYVNDASGNDSWTGNSSTYKGDNIGPKQTIQAGINATESGGTLYIANGIYNLMDEGMIGEGGVEIVVDRNLTIYGEDENYTIIDGRSGCRDIMINENTTVVITSLTIRGGKAIEGNYAYDGENGGGIYNQGNLTLQNCLIYGNQAGRGGDGTSKYNAGNGGNGGGIYNANILTLINCDLYNNEAGNGGNAHMDIVPTKDGGNGGSGGGIYNCNSLNINNCSIYDNSAGSGGYSQGEASAKSGGDGGGIYNGANSITHITNSCISNNTCVGGSLPSLGQDCGSNGINGGNGGAIYNNGTLTLENCTLNYNKAGDGCSGYYEQKLNGGGGSGGSGGNGGAICNINVLIIKDCEISNNYAGNGGNGGMGLQSSDGFKGGAGGSGGAIYNTGNLTITGTLQNSVKIISNSAGDGGMGGPGQLETNEYGWDNLEPGNGGNGGNGGAIYNAGIIKSIANALIQGNMAGNGGNGGYFLTHENDEGHAASNPGSGGSGGGIYSSGEFDILENSTIVNNIAGNGGNGNVGGSFASSNGGSGGNGGGLYIMYPNPGLITQINFINCNMSNNRAGNGGNGGNTKNLNGWQPSSQPGNGGSGGYGGGIFLENNNTPLFNLYMTNSLINNNSAGNGGNGGVDNYFNSRPSNGGNGGNGGGIGVTVKDFMGNNILSVLESTISNNNVGTGGIKQNGGKNGVNGVGGGIYSNEYIVVNFCRIVNNTPQAIYLNLPSSSADNLPSLVFNWWGNNADPKDNFAGNNILSNFYSPWLILNLTAIPKTLNTNQNSNIVASLIIDSNGNNTRYYYGYWVPDGIPVAFETTWGTLNPQNGVTTTGTSNTVFTAGTISGNAMVYATVDSQTVFIPIQILSADVDIVKTVNNTMPNVGDSVTFTVTVKNNGPDKAVNICIKDKMPAGFGNAEIIPSLGTYDPYNGIWAIPELESGTTATLIMNVTVTAALAGKNVTNTASKASWDQFDPNPNNDNASATIYVPVVNITISQHPWYYSSTTKTYQKKSDYDNTIVYFVNVANRGPDNATGIIIKEVLGSGYNFVGLSTEGVGTATYDPSTRIITWSISSMPKGTSARLSIFALVAGVGNNTPNLTVNASLSHVDQYDTSGSDKYSSWSINVDPSADIQVNQTQQTSTEDGHQYVTYTVNVTNNGQNNASGIQITDTLPAGLTNPIITPVLGSYTLGSNNTLVWTIPVLNVGESTTLTIKSLINGSGTFVNTATKTGQGENDWNYNNNAQTCILTVSGNYTPQVNMNIRQYPWYYRGATDSYQKVSGYYQTIVYTVDVRNTGPTDATGVIVKEVLGDGYQFINCTTEGVGTATYDPSTRTITWNVGFMPKGGMAWLSIFALVTATGNNTPELTVNASLSHVDQSDISNSRKYASYSIYVPAPTEVSIVDNQSNLYITGTLNHSPEIGKNFTITFKLGNKGPNTAKNVIIKIPIPEGLEFTGASVDQGTWYYDQKTRTLIWYAGDVEVGDPYLYLTLKPLKQGQYTIKPQTLTTTYNLYSKGTIIPLNINVKIPENNNGNSGKESESLVKAASKTVSMKDTGIPISSLILAILMVVGGLFGVKRK